MFFRILIVAVFFGVIVLLGVAMLASLVRILLVYMVQPRKQGFGGSAHAIKKKSHQQR
jgi:hypothetical protein